MTGWRLDLTVMTDLAASMFAACFMVLLILISLAQLADPAPPSAIDARTDLQLVDWQVPAPAQLVDMLHDHDAPRGTSIDLYPDRIDMVGSAGRQTATAGELGAVTSGLAGPVRLYVFSNALHHDVRARLGALPVTEMSVPRALIGTDGRWSGAFRDLLAQQTTREQFRAGLAALLAGGTQGTDSAAGESGAPPAAAPPKGTGLSGLFGTLAAIVFPLLGAGVVLIAERRRFSSGQHRVPAR